MGGTFLKGSVPRFTPILALSFILAFGMQFEAHDAAMDLNAIRRHERYAATRPALQPLVNEELAAREEYDAATRARDQARFDAAKAAMWRAVDAVKTALGEK